MSLAPWTTRVICPDCGQPADIIRRHPEIALHVNPTTQQECRGGGRPADSLFEPGDPVLFSLTEDARGVPGTVERIDPDRDSVTVRLAGLAGVIHTQPRYLRSAAGRRGNLQPRLFRVGQTVKVYPGGITAEVTAATWHDHDPQPTWVYRVRQADGSTATIEESRLGGDVATLPPARRFPDGARVLVPRLNERGAIIGTAETMGHEWLYRVQMDNKTEPYCLLESSLVADPLPAPSTPPDAPARKFPDGARVKSAAGTIGIVTGAVLHRGVWQYAVQPLGCAGWYQMDETSLVPEPADHCAAAGPDDNTKL